MTRAAVSACFLLLIASSALADVYMHMPRGSNNRLNERSANRNNANRLFDSQNNNRGGYNAGDTDDQNGFQNEGQIYNMQYFQSAVAGSGTSQLTIEWTNQHGCGGDENTGPHKLNCNIVLQYMVQEDGCDPSDDDCIRNGRNTQTQNFQNPPAGNNNAYQETAAQYQSRKMNSVQESRGLHESFDYYNACYMRSRNRGLFTADQNLRRNNNGNSSAIYTRQNPNGNRRGYECPEERDYYPYWHPTPWRDIAILSDNMTQCTKLLEESFNVMPRGSCKETYTGTSTFREWSFYNNQADCERYGGTWFTEYAYIDIDPTITTEVGCNQRNNFDGLPRVWARRRIDSASPQCLVLPPAPTCSPAAWSRVNHLGNGRDGVPLNYTWTMPYFPSTGTKKVVVRIRYNISTDDYDPFNTNSMHNEDLNTGVLSPVQQNPNVNIGAGNNKPLRLAINTAQFGRTFQDRSHIMDLLHRSQITHPAGQSCNIHNLNVRGKRGNIVQTYPSVEYDFIPNRLQVTENDCIHIQWTGSNTHNNGAPGGDGQTGDAGEGRGGTDRHNMVQIPNPNSNYPMPYEQNTMWAGAEMIWKPTDWQNDTRLGDVDFAVAFASSGYYHCYESSTCTQSVQGRSTRLQKLLNNASPSFMGAVMRFRPGTYYYICSRNNNFTNRSQKGMLTVTAA